MRTVHKRHLERFLPAAPVALLGLPCFVRVFGPAGLGQVPRLRRA